MSEMLGYNEKRWRVEWKPEGNSYGPDSLVDCIELNATNIVSWEGYAVAINLHVTQDLNFEWEVIRVFPNYISIQCIGETHEVLERQRKTLQRELDEAESEVGRIKKALSRLEIK